MSVEKAWPLVVYEAGKYDVVTVKEKVVCWSVSSLVESIKYEGHAVIKKNKHLFDKNIVINTLKSQSNDNYLRG